MKKPETAVNSIERMITMRSIERMATDHSVESIKKIKRGTLVQNLINKVNIIS